MGSKKVLPLKVTDRDGDTMEKDYCIGCFLEVFVMTRKWDIQILVTEQPK
jgi:hypothetical protein